MSTQAVPGTAPVGARAARRARWRGLANVHAIRGAAGILAFLALWQIGVLLHLPVVAKVPAPLEVARAAFGPEVIEHYLNNADVELRAFEAAVTDWELVRGFERL